MLPHFCSPQGAWWVLWLPLCYVADPSPGAEADQQTDEQLPDSQSCFPVSRFVCLCVCVCVGGWVGGWVFDRTVALVIDDHCQ